MLFVLGVYESNFCRIAIRTAAIAAIETAAAATTSATTTCSFAAISSRGQQNDGIAVARMDAWDL